MISQRTLFLNHLAQTSDSPLLLEIKSAEGLYLIDAQGKKFMDLISGIAVSNIGHRHPKVLKALEDQIGKHLHVMVYGEYVQSPQTRLAEKLAMVLPASLSNFYFVNSGSEAIEGAMKLAKRYSGRSEIISFQNAYHGSTQGALSIGGEEQLKSSFRPLLPDVQHLRFNSIKDLDRISERTACVILETVQGEAGVVVPEKNYLLKLKAKCEMHDVLLVLDEIQTGFGRTGTMFAFEQFGIIPDILCLGKAMGGGMPIGAFVSSKEIMSSLMSNPVLGHISTFGGHPVCCAAALANLEVLLEEDLISGVRARSEKFISILKHPSILEVRACGLMLAIEFKSEEQNRDIISECIKEGIITDWFLFNAKSMRIAPPLNITIEEIEKACSIVLRSITKFSY